MIDAQALPVFMSAEELNFLIHNAFARQIGQDLMSEKAWMNSFCDDSRCCVFFHDLPDPVRLEQIDGAFLLSKIKNLIQIIPGRANVGVGPSLAVMEKAA